MSERGEEAGRDSPVGTAVRVEPNAAVVSIDARVPPDPREEMAMTLRPVATARAVGRRLARTVGRHGE